MTLKNDDDKECNVIKFSGGRETKGRPRLCRITTEVDAFFGKQLRNFRKSASLSQAELGNQVGIAFSRIQKYENGTIRIEASRLWLICEVLGVEPQKFFVNLEKNLATLAAGDQRMS